MPQTNYEEMTVPELKDLADQRGVEILHDARKAEIVAALEASDYLLKPKEPEAEEPPSEGKEGKEYENVYTRQMSSTETALVSNEDFTKLKLLS